MATEWKSLAGRITIFLDPSPVALPSALGLYKKVWTDDPINYQGSTNPLAPSLAQGKRGGLGVTCTINATRVDFTLTSPGAESTTEPPKLYVIENSAELHTELTRIAHLVGQNLLANNVLRVATFLQIISIEDSPAVANRVLMSIIPSRYRFKLNTEEEFVLQISQPRMSTRVENVKLNLINKWSVDRFGVMSVVMPMAAAPLTAPQPQAAHLAEFITASIAFDHNNMPVPRDQPLSSSQQASLLLEELALTTTSIRESAIDVKGFEDEKLLH